VDVAPLLLHSLDVPVPDGLDGRVPTELLEPEALGRRPVRHAPAGVPEAAAPVAAAAADYDPEEEATIVDRLRALGYVE
jgi:hypothetical protein